MRVNAKGEQLKLEILIFEQAFERITAPYVKNLKLLGIDAKIRMVDPAQYQQRLKDFDFDITTERYTMRNTPGVELRSYFGSRGGQDGRLAQSRRHLRSGRRRADRAGDRAPRAARS